MPKNDLIDLADNPELISGIYNYCDRWCEHCPFTSRCLVYATENDGENDPASNDINNAAFWRKLESVFKQAREMITAWAEEQGVDLQSPEAKSAIAEHQRQKDDVEKHELSVAAARYAKSVNRWFEGAGELETISDSAADSDDGYEAERLNDAIEVIRWYQHQIAAKTVRALMSREDEDDEIEEDSPKDSDGSIKVALIGIDRSISAWRIIHLCRPDMADSIIPLILSLERLRLGTEQAFPNARDFVRPGFDEGAVDVVN